MFAFVLLTFFFFLSSSVFVYIFFFFFQAEDGIRDKLVTGVQTCALPIFMTCWRRCSRSPPRLIPIYWLPTSTARISWRPNRQMEPACRNGRSSWRNTEIGRASCRERV